MNNCKFESLKKEFNETKCFEKKRELLFSKISLILERVDEIGNMYLLIKNVLYILDDECVCYTKIKNKVFDPLYELANYFSNYKKQINSNKLNVHTKKTSCLEINNISETSMVCYLIQIKNELNDIEKKFSDGDFKLCNIPMLYDLIEIIDLYLEVS